MKARAERSGFPIGSRMDTPWKRQKHQNGSCAQTIRDQGVQPIVQVLYAAAGAWRVRVVTACCIGGPYANKAATCESNLARLRYTFVRKRVGTVRRGAHLTKYSVNI